MSELGRLRYVWLNSQQGTDLAATTYIGALQDRIAKLEEELRQRGLDVSDVLKKRERAEAERAEYVILYESQNAAMMAVQSRLAAAEAENERIARAAARISEEKEQAENERDEEHTRAEDYEYRVTEAEAALAERDRMLKRHVKAGNRMVKGINAYFGSSAGQEVDQMNDARIGWQQLRARTGEGEVPKAR